MTAALTNSDLLFATALEEAQVLGEYLQLQEQRIGVQAFFREVLPPEYWQHDPRPEELLAQDAFVLAFRESVPEVQEVIQKILSDAERAEPASGAELQSVRDELVAWYASEELKLFLAKFAEVEARLAAANPTLQGYRAREAAMDQVPNYDAEIAVFESALGYVDGSLEPDPQWEASEGSSESVLAQGVGQYRDFLLGRVESLTAIREGLKFQVQVALGDAELKLSESREAVGEGVEVDGEVEMDKAAALAWDAEVEADPAVLRARQNLATFTAAVSDLEAMEPGDVNLLGENLEVLIGAARVVSNYESWGLQQELAKELNQALDLLGAEDPHYAQVQGAMAEFEGIAAPTAQDYRWITAQLSVYQSFAGAQRLNGNNVQVRRLGMELAKWESQGRPQGADFGKIQQLAQAAALVTTVQAKVAGLEELSRKSLQTDWARFQKGKPQGQRILELSQQYTRVEVLVSQGRLEEAQRYYHLLESIPGNRGLVAKARSEETTKALVVTAATILVPGGIAARTALWVGKGIRAVQGLRMLRGLSAARGNFELVGSALLSNAAVFTGVHHDRS